MYAAICLLFVSYNHAVSGYGWLIRYAKGQFVVQVRRKYSSVPLLNLALDAIPLAAYTINEIIWPLQGWTTALYFTATYILLTVQLVFTIFALRVIYGKAKELSSVQAKQVRLL